MNPIITGIAIGTFASMVYVTIASIDRHNTCMSQIEGALETAEQHRLTMERLRDEYWIIRKEPGNR